MSSGRVSNQQGYAGVAQALAGQALAAAFDTAPHRPREGESRWAMANALPAARVLIDRADDNDRAALALAAAALRQTLADPSGKVTDGFGHTRPVYAYLALHLLGSAARQTGDDAARATVRRAVTDRLDQPAEDADPRLLAWRRVVAVQHGLVPPELDLPPVDEPVPLVALGRDDLIDAWTYRELIGQHGLHLCALLEARDDLARRVQQAAEYHLGHTQPDYTTYQPWGLSAFASDPQTAVFAEQQLHDVATHLSIEGPGGAVLPALLLADAWATMSGGLVSAWSVG